MTSNFEVNQGTDFSLLITLRRLDSTLVDLTGYSFRGQAKKSYADLKPAFSFSFTLLDQLVELGKVSLDLHPDDTSSILIRAPEAYIYDIEMIDATGRVTRILEGTITLRPEVTK